MRRGRRRKKWEEKEEDGEEVTHLVMDVSRYFYSLQIETS